MEEECRFSACGCDLECRRCLERRWWRIREFWAWESRRKRFYSTKKPYYCCCAPWQHGKTKEEEVSVQEKLHWGSFQLPTWHFRKCFGNLAKIWQKTTASHASGNNTPHKKYCHRQKIFDNGSLPLWQLLDA